MNDAYEHDLAEQSLAISLRELSPLHQAIVAYTTLLSLRSTQGSASIWEVAFGLNIPMKDLEPIVDELYDLGVAYPTGEVDEGFSRLATGLAETLLPLAVGPGGRPSSKDWRQLRAEAQDRLYGVEPFCIYCKTQAGTLALDHAVPVSRGGSNHPHNLVFACIPCNSSKRDKTYAEFMEARSERQA